MTASLVVLAGESIVCPGCGAVLLTFEEDVHGGPGEFAESARSAFGGSDGDSACFLCGEPWGITAIDDGNPKALGEEVGPRIHLRSADGAWTGWRGLGGE